jgi:hypothetical protein
LLIIGRTHGHQQHLARRCAQREAQGAIAVIGIKPVVGGPHGEGGGHADSFVTRPGNLEEDLLLALQHDLPVVHAAGGVHDPVGFNQLGAGQTFIGLVRVLDFLVRQSGRFKICLACHPLYIVNRERGLRTAVSNQLRKQHLAFSTQHSALRRTHLALST